MQDVAYPNHLTTTLWVIHRHSSGHRYLQADRQADIHTGRGWGTVARCSESTTYTKSANDSRNQSHDLSISCQSNATHTLYKYTNSTWFHWHFLHFTQLLHFCKFWCKLLLQGIITITMQCNTHLFVTLSFTTVGLLQK